MDEGPGMTAALVAGPDARELLAAGFEAADVGLCLVDEAGRIAAPNAAFCRIAGWPAAEAVGRELDEVLVDTSGQAIHRQVEPEYGATRPSTDRQIRARDGTEVFVKISDGARVVVRGRPYTAITVANISRRMRAEDERAATMRMLHVALDTVPGLVNVKDRQSRYVFMNTYQARLYGVAPEDAVGWTAGEFLGASYGEYTGALDRKVFDTGEAIPFFEEEYPVASGERRTFLTSKAPVFDASGQVAHLVSVAIDITDQKRAERSLIAIKEEAESANRLKSVFLANMSHELRTPLNAIIGFAEIIAEQMFGAVSPPNYRDYARNIRAAGSHLLAVINDILDMTRIEAGQTRLQEERFDLGALVGAAIALVAGTAAEKSLALDCDLAGDLPLLEADPRKVKQMLINLLSNAIKFTDRGSVRVAAALHAGGELTVAIADTGIGIAAEDIDKAMAPFGQVDSTLARRHQGTGLGLPLTKALIELHDGRFEIESVPGAGTTTRLVFPAVRVIPRD
jgi:PAS domain S-box-containing protein